MIEFEVRVLFPWGHYFDHALDQVVEDFDLVLFTPKFFEEGEVDVYTFSIVARDLSESLALKEIIKTIVKDINKIDNEKGIQDYIKGV